MFQTTQFESDTHNSGSPDGVFTESGCCQSENVLAGSMSKNLLTIRVTRIAFQIPARGFMKYKRSWCPAFAQPWQRVPPLSPMSHSAGTAETVPLLLRTAGDRRLCRGVSLCNGNQTGSSSDMTMLSTLHGDCHSSICRNENKRKSALAGGPSLKGGTLLLLTRSSQLGSRSGKGRALIACMVQFEEVELVAASVLEVTRGWKWLMGNDSNAAVCDKQ
jgi:hypothetical protein